MAQSSTASPNGLQEVELKIGSQTFTVRPTYKLLARIERIMDQPARELGARCYAGQMPFAMRNGVKELGFSDIVNLLGAILADNPKAPGPDEIGEIFMEQGGYLDNVAPLGVLLTRHIQGNVEYEREMRERARETETPEEGTAGNANENPPTAEKIAAE